MRTNKPASQPGNQKSPAKVSATADVTADAAPAASLTPPASSPAADAAVVSAPEPDNKPTQPPAAKTSAVDQTVARHQKALAEALEKAEAISYDPAQPPKASKAAKPAKAGKPVKAEKAEKAEKPVKARKVKLVRDSYAMPEDEFARIAELKKRLSGLGSEVRKSEVLRCGIAVLAALNDTELKAVMERVERIKTGRPSKK